MLGSTVRSVALILIAVLGTFVFFHSVAFPLFRNVADLGPANQNVEQLRSAFLALFAGLIASALLAGALVGRLTRTPWMLVFMVAVPVVVVLGLFSFYLLDFLNACEVGHSLVVDSRC